jgi:hypothetical protein
LGAARARHSQTKAGLLDESLSNPSHGYFAVLWTGSQVKTTTKHGENKQHRPEKQGRKQVDERSISRVGMGFTN